MILAAGLISCLKWTAGFFVLVIVSPVSGNNFFESVIRGLWVAPVSGLAIGWLFYILVWGSPISILSGPDGIVREKGGNRILFRWGQIENYEVVRFKNMNRLYLTLQDGSEHYFFIPEKVDTAVIKKEMESNLRR